MPRMKAMNAKVPVISLIGTVLLVGCLHAGQTRSPGPDQPVNLNQRLSQLLNPLQVQVAASAFSSTEGKGTRELRVNWTAPAAAPPNGVGAAVAAQGNFSVPSQREYAEPAPRQRSLQIAEDQIFIAAVDRSRQLKSWTVMQDPRVLRSEGPGPDGTLTGQRVMLDHADFFVSIPDDPEITEVRIFEPVRSGGDFTLSAIATIPVTR